MLSRQLSAKTHFSHPTYLLGQYHIIDPSPSFYPLNQYLLSCFITLIFALSFYLIVSSLWYYLLYIHHKHIFIPSHTELIDYPQQIFFDIKWSLLNIIGQVPLVSLVKLGYTNHSKIQYQFHLTPQTLFYILLHFIFDQFFTYWLHRILHHPTIYPHLHIIHHQSKSITPFSGFAFHPIDAFFQALPFLSSCYFIPVPIDIVLLHGLVTSLWAISIHDNVNVVPFKGILYAGSHSIHHFTWGQHYNYGKFTSICDRLFGTYCDPSQITGYGYQCPPWFKIKIDLANTLFDQIIPARPNNEINRARSYAHQFRTRKLKTTISVKN